MKEEKIIFNGKEYIINDHKIEDIKKIEFRQNGFKAINKDKSFEYYTRCDDIETEVDFLDRFINCLCKMKPMLFNNDVIGEIKEIFEKRTEKWTYKDKQELNLAIQEILSSKISRKDKSIRRYGESKEAKERSF